MINRSVLVGRMTKNPELRRTPQGDAVTSFTLAVNRNFTSKDGQQQTDFINCVIWNKPAENVEQYCSKGSLVGVEGKIQTRTYDDKDGKKVFVTEVRCDSVQFLDTRQQDQAPINNQKVEQMANNNYYHNGPSTSNNTKPAYLDDDINTYDIVEDDIQF